MNMPHLRSCLTTLFVVVSTCFAQAEPTSSQILNCRLAVENQALFTLSSESYGFLNQTLQGYGHVVLETYPLFKGKSSKTSAAVFVVSKNNLSYGCRPCKPVKIFLEIPLFTV